MFCVALFEILITAIGVALVFFTLKAAQTSAREAKRAADEAKRQADIAEKQVQITKQASENQLSPYLHVSAIELDWDVNGPYADVEVTNSGTTPATWFEVACACMIAAPPRMPDMKVPGDDALCEYAPWSALGGMQSQKIGFRTDTMREYEKAYRTNPSARHGLFFIVGRVRYGDIFDNEYMSEFVYWTNDTAPRGPTAPPNMLARSSGRNPNFVKIKSA